MMMCPALGSKYVQLSEQCFQAFPARRFAVFTNFVQCPRESSVDLNADSRSEVARQMLRFCVSSKINHLFRARTHDEAEFMQSVEQYCICRPQSFYGHLVHLRNDFLFR